MTPDESLLRHAAAHVRALAAAATEGPWEVRELLTAEGSVVRGAGGDRHVLDDGCGADQAWIAALGPQVALPLAAWLEAEAGWKAADPGLVDPEALDVARALLGEDHPTPALSRHHRARDRREQETR